MVVGEQTSKGLNSENIADSICLQSVKMANKYDLQRTDKVRRTMISMFNLVEKE